jgi:putative permease
MRESGTEQPGERRRRETRVAPIQWGQWAAAAVLGAGAVYLVVRLHKILLLFYLALLLGFAINAFILWLERRHVSRGLAVAGLGVIFIAFVVALGFWVIPPAVAQAQHLLDNLPVYQERAQTWVNGVFVRYPELRERLTGDGGTLPNLTSKPGSVLRQVGGWAVGIGGLLFSAFLLFFLVLYGLIDPRPMARALFDLTPPDSHDRVERTISGIQDKVVAWAGGTFLLMGIVGLLVWIGLVILHVPQALLYGIIAAVGEGIPNLGPVLSAIPPVSVMLITDPAKAAWVVALFVLVQQVENNLIVPLVMGNRLNVHPWALIFMMLVMGELFGLLGVFLATPTTAILGVIYEEWIPKPGRAGDEPAIHRIGRIIGGRKGEASDSC